MGERTIAAILNKKNQGQLLLSEEEGKHLLESMGINVPAGVLVSTLNEARQAAYKLGFPVVFKGLVEGITHKSDYGLVQVGVSNEMEMESCFFQMADKCRKLGKQWSILIEQQKKGVLETVVGLTTDPNFGKVMMFGLGGIFVEVLKDVSFKLCPITRRDAEDMIESLQAAKMFKGVRGQKPVDTGKIVDFLLSVGGENGIAGKYGDAIDVLEINPAIINESGTITALDAVIRLSATTTASPENGHAKETVDMERLFNPKTMGVVG
ncbi:MAG: acetate--CoA ligase family protein, partial [Desulfobacterales bacterium]|nr:acetate--CoA ligase family protein [Desulfobacterales bacterium]